MYLHGEQVPFVLVDFYGVDMKANEFVKKHGWQAVTNAVNSTNEKETAFFETKNIEETKGINGTTVSLDVKVYRFPYLDVKRLIEMHDLVERIGGLAVCKDEMVKLFAIGDDRAFALEKAIADVESCQ